MMAEPTLLSVNAWPILSWVGFTECFASLLLNIFSFGILNIRLEMILFWKFKRWMQWWMAGCNGAFVGIFLF